MTREEDIKNAVEVLRKGGVILYPTDTVWGIGCDATNAEAVKRVYDIKQRDDSKAMICLVDSDARLQRYVRQVPDVAWQLIDSLQAATVSAPTASKATVSKATASKATASKATVPDGSPSGSSPSGSSPSGSSPSGSSPSGSSPSGIKPTTIILDGAVNLAPNLIAEDGSIALRITNEPFSKELCYRFQKALVSTSANISGEPAAQNYCDIDPRIIEQVDYVCWTRRQEHKPHTPSSIIRLRPDGEVTIIRS